MVLRHACSVLQTRPFTCSVAGHKAWSPLIRTAMPSSCLHKKARRAVNTNWCPQPDSHRAIFCVKGRRVD